MNVTRTILLVDDDPINLTVLAGALGTYECLTASTGEEAVEICSQQTPDMVLLDIMMPGIDGYETCRRLRANPASSGMKIILISAKSMVEERMAGYEAGADDYLIKPFDLDELRAKIEVFLRLKTSEEVNDLKTGLLNLVAHEIRTPMTGILPAAEILLTEDEVSVEDRKLWAAMILENGTRLMTLAERGLILCQLRAEMGVSFKDHEVHFAEVAETMLKDAVANAACKNISIASENTSSAIVRGDQDMLAVALCIVVENVLEICEPGHPLQIEVRDGADRVEFSISPEAVVEGRGLRERFAVFAERETGGEVVGGTLDLALAREIVHTHGGRLEVESTPTGGVGVVGWLPTCSAEVAGVSPD